MPRRKLTHACLCVNAIRLGRHEGRKEAKESAPWADYNLGLHEIGHILTICSTSTRLPTISNLMLKNSALIGSLLGRSQITPFSASLQAWPTLFARGASSHLESAERSLPVFNLDFQQVCPSFSCLTLFAWQYSAKSQAINESTWGTQDHLSSLEPAF